MNRRCFFSLILCLAVAVQAWGQLGKSPDGFLDFRWGASVDEVKKKLLARPEVTFRHDLSDGMAFNDGTFAGHPVNTWRMTFSGGKLYRAEVSLNGGANRIEVHKAVKKELMNKYGAPARTDGNGVCRWFFPQSATHPMAESIKLYFSSPKHNEVHVRYSSDSLAGGKDED